MPAPEDHVYLIRRGWRHADLIDMDVREVVFWLDQQIAYDRAVAEAIREQNRR